MRGNDEPSSDDDDVANSATIEKTISTLKDVLTSGKDAFIQNKTLGDVKITMGDEKAGLRHIINRRFEERMFAKNSDCTLDDALNEISAILVLIGEGINKQEAKKQENGKYALVYHGVEAFFGKDSRGRFLLTGFVVKDEKEVAKGAIKSVIDKYGYTSDFLDIYNQVGAKAASFAQSIAGDEKKASQIEQIAEEFFQLDQGREKLDSEYYMLYEREREISNGNLEKPHISIKSYRNKRKD